MNKPLHLMMTAGLSMGIAGSAAIHASHLWAEVQTQEKTELKTEAKTDVETPHQQVEVQTEENVKIEALATQFKVPEAAVRDLRQTQKLGWGEISHLLAISQKSGQTTDSILALRKNGMGWGEIAQKFNLKMGEINREVHRSEEALEQERHETLKEAKEEKDKKGEALERKGEKLEVAGERLENKGDRLEDRGERLEDSGRDQASERLERQGERLERQQERLERREERVDRLTRVGTLLGH